MRMFITSHLSDNSNFKLTFKVIFFTTLKPLKDDLLGGTVDKHPSANGLIPGAGKIPHAWSC